MSNNNWHKWPKGEQAHNAIINAELCPICGRQLLIVEHVNSYLEDNCYRAICTYCETQYVSIYTTPETIKLSSGNPEADKIAALEARITNLEALVRRMAAYLQEERKRQMMPRHQDAVTTHEAQKPDNEAADFIAKYHYLL